MDPQMEEKYMSAVIEALSSGVPEGDIRKALQEQKVSPEDIERFIQAGKAEVAAMKQGGAQQGAPQQGAEAEGYVPADESQGPAQSQSPDAQQKGQRHLTAEEGMQMIGDIDIEVDDLIDIIRTTLAMSGKEIDRMIGMIIEKDSEMQGGAQQGAPQQQPGGQEQMQGQPQY